MSLDSNDAFNPQTETPLLATLQSCVHKPHAPFYAPGHKHGRGSAKRLVELLGAQVFQADLPELPELDNLFAPQGVIQQAQALAAEAFGADRTWFLANGSTSGVIAAILATCNPGDKLILPRNIHQSALSGLILSGAVPIFVQPEYDPHLDLAHSLTPTAVATALAQHPDAKAVLMVYPTYYGVCGDVATIAHLAHQHNIPLLVDEAHGAHFAFHPALPIAALVAGADLAVQSTHKVLSAMTQAAMLHTRGDRIDGDRISKALQLVQSTSPSYLLLASLDAARYQMATQGKLLLEQTLQLADEARSRLKQISGLSTLQPEQAGSAGFVALDRTRLTVTVSGLGIDGFTADAILNEQLGVTAELPSLQHLTFMISLGNTRQDIEQLVQSFETLATMYRDREVGEAGEVEKAGEVLQSTLFSPSHLSYLPRSPLSPRAAFFAASETLPIAQTVNRISAELVCPYPPGIPVLMPGEVVTAAAIAHLQAILALGGTISGCTDLTLKTLKVVK
ncbi:aminotransferase class I/II-fold pyridoxal phosphate-dependent enzyme [Phormidium sp. FACHB-592]|uniref:Aminotransferase class I/II-fold pyridoxal phosphate-dependent enzyme n=1 Tax=Stenomitos frigidus AS-A4 TaxID=2933935 RepID=A0ABV0KJ46_9CYAN|nr:aminotransferase class I/II-fold pyridoxal phosphate-dependent enzyme [Phormidium sp. FACHB-592]MBD2074815.1 aminotransferase class I/II-fold pyridoxal phosphate-dependent enzyme [Phormidium sp. FACHB-592]